MNKKKAIKIATASAIAASGFVAVAPAQAAVKTTNVNTVVNTAISKMAAAYDGYHKPGLQGKIPPTAKIRQLTTNAEAAYDAAVAAIAKDGGTKSQKAAFTKKLNAKKYLLTRAQGYVKAIDVNLNAAKKALDKAVASGKAKDVKAAEAALVKTAATFEKAVKGVYGPSTRKALVAKYHAPALAKAATVKDELTVYNAYKEIESGNLIEKDVAKAGDIIAKTKATVDKLAAGDKRDTKLVKNLLDAVAKNNEKYYKGIGEVKTIMAISATTVEVTYKNAVENVDASKYSIEGLTIASAVVKQTDNKTVILTTSTQEGAKEYTVKSGAIKVGTFKGVSAVIPTAIKVTTPSIQGTIGKEVTVKATVTVPEGQSKAGIPVTVNVPASANGLNAAITEEVYTDANGEASYSYTRYSGVSENVTVYPTGNRTASSTASVYWAAAAQLTVKDITAETTLVNGSKKVYEINSAKNANGYVFVTFAENLNVTPDKVIKTVGAEGVSTYVLSANGDVSNATAAYPHEVSTGGKAVIAVKLDNNGKANLVLSGSDASVTPIVFEGTHDGGTTYTPQDYKAAYSATSLQAKATTVTFALKQELGLAIEAKGVQNAAISNTLGTGGRDYVVTYTDKAGKAAAAGTKVLVAIPKVGGSVQVLNSNGTQATLKNSDLANNYYEITIASAGKATFTVISANENDYVSPVVFIDNGLATGSGALDKNDLQTTGEITYFVKAVTYAAELKVEDEEEEAVSSLVANNRETAFFKYALVDQNGKVRKADKDTTVTFEVKVGTGKATVQTSTLNSGETKTFEAVIREGSSVAQIAVKGQEPTTVSVSATGSKAGIVLPSTKPESVSVAFTAYSTVDIVTGSVSARNITANTLSVLGVDEKTYSFNYTNGKFQENGSPIDLPAFEELLSDYSVTSISVTTDANGVQTFNIKNKGPANPNLGNPTLLSFTDTDTDANEIGGNFTFSSPAGLNYTVEIGNFVKTGKTVANTTVDIPENTTLGNIKLTILDPTTGKNATQTLTITDVKPTEVAASGVAEGKKVTGIVYSEATGTVTYTLPRTLSATGIADLNAQGSSTGYVGANVTAPATAASVDITSNGIKNNEVVAAGVVAINSAIATKDSSGNWKLSESTNRTYKLEWKNAAGTIIKTETLKVYVVAQ